MYMNILYENNIYIYISNILYTSDTYISIIPAKAKKEGINGYTSGSNLSLSQSSKSFFKSAACYIYINYINIYIYI